MRVSWKSVALAALCALPCRSEAASPHKAIYFFDKGNKTWCGYPSLGELRRHVAVADQFEVEAGGIFFTGEAVTKVEESFTNADAETSLFVRYVVKPNGSISEATITLNDEGSHIWRFDAAHKGYAPVSKPKDVDPSVPEALRKVERVSGFPFFKLIAAFAKAPDRPEICL